MNWLDYIIIAIIVLGVVYGAIKGFVHSVFSIGGLIISIIAAKKYHMFVAKFLIDYTRIEDILLGFIQKNKVTEVFMFSIPVNKGFNDLYQYITMVIINCIALLLAFMAARVCMLLLEALLSGVFKLPVLSVINRSGGAVLGLTQSILILLLCFAIFVPMSSIGKFDFIHQAIGSSLLSKYFYKYNFILGWALNTALNIFIK
ncbi:MAG: CvpA family protein [Lutispora sp.]|nr:CvpA family protein [Lutispora sp.]MDD4834269.1 CvpA family protein [Lutispora sp.]